jgi:hypothetical protein
MENTTRSDTLHSSLLYSSLLSEMRRFLGFMGWFRGLAEITVGLCGITEKKKSIHLKRMENNIGELIQGW